MIVLITCQQRIYFHFQISIWSIQELRRLQNWREIDRDKLPPSPKQVKLPHPFPKKNAFAICSSERFNQIFSLILISTARPKTRSLHEGHLCRKWLLLLQQRDALGNNGLNPLRNEEFIFYQLLIPPVLHCTTATRRKGALVGCQLHAGECFYFTS